MFWYIYIYIYIYILFFDAKHLPAQDHFIVKVSWFGENPLDEGSALSRHSQQRDVHTLGGLEPAILARDLPQNHALNRAATVIGCIQILSYSLWGYETCIKLQAFQCHVILLLSSGFMTVVAGLSETSENFWQINVASAAGQTYR